MVNWLVFIFSEKILIVYIFLCVVIFCVILSVNVVLFIDGCVVRIIKLFWLNFVVIWFKFWYFVGIFGVWLLFWLSFLVVLYICFKMFWMFLKLLFLWEDDSFKIWCFVLFKIVFSLSLLLYLLLVILFVVWINLCFNVCLEMILV